ncbi:MAG: TIGR00730 family Rossman fold protein [Mariprofundaceae bacterium]
MSIPHEVTADADQENTYKQAILNEVVHLLSEEKNDSNLKMLSHIMHEIREGMAVFRPYRAVRKVSIFGSARTVEDHPHYQQAKKCGKALADVGFMVITGGGGGIMQAANEGAGSDHSFGININLPMEQDTNSVLIDSPRHFYCQYFFTRKMFFLKESDAVVLAPGGFGTLDEAFETLTLLQTGRTPPMPVVMLEAPGDDYWGPLLRSWMRRLIDEKLISADDHHLFFHTDSVESAARHIEHFYRNYHSFHYAGENIMLRLLNPLSDMALERLNAEFSDVLQQGEIEQSYHWSEVDDVCYQHMPRLRMHLDRRRMNILPQIIQRLNYLVELG